MERAEPRDEDEGGEDRPRDRSPRVAGVHRANRRARFGPCGATDRYGRREERAEEKTRGEDDPRRDAGLAPEERSRASVGAPDDRGLPVGEMRELMRRDPDRGGEQCLQDSE